MAADSPLECSHWVAVTFWEEENQNHLWVTFVGWFEVTDMSQFDVSLSCEVFYFLLNDVHTLWRKLLKYCRKSDCCYFSYTSLWDWVWVLCNNVLFGRKFSHFFNMKIMSFTHANDFFERSVPIHCHPSLRGLRLLCKFPHYDLHFTQHLIVKSRHSTFGYA